MGWILYELCLNPAAQAELQRELDAVLQGPSEEVTLDDAAALLHTQQVIKEALRLHPPIPIVAKECLEDTRLGDYNVPAGSVLAISISDLHMNPDLFPSPLRFDPTRFEKSHAVNPFAFAPFAAGPRNCIGQKFAMLVSLPLLDNVLRAIFSTEVSTLPDPTSCTKHELIYVYFKFVYCPTPLPT